jgi:hypothetical protein
MFHRAHFISLPLIGQLSGFVPRSFCIGRNDDCRHGATEWHGALAEKTNDVGAMLLVR